MKPLTLPLEFAHLSATDLDLINDWLDEHPRRVVHDKLREKFNIDPSTDKLQRYDQKRLRARALAETTELKVDVHDFLALSNGQPTRFDQASLILIQKRVLELAADPKTKPGLLKDLFRIATYADRKAWVDHRKEINTARLALDNRKQDLREKQFEHQKSIDEKKFPAPEPPAPPLTPEQKQEKLWDIFCLSEEERARRRAKNKPATETSSCAFPRPGGEGQGEGVQNTSEAPFSSSSADAVLQCASSDPQSKIENQKSEMPCPSGANSASPLLVAGAARTEGQGEGVQSHSKAPLSITAIESCPLCASGIDHLSPESLAAHSDTYTVLRAEEFCAHERSVAGWNSANGDRPQYITQFQECPCGSPLPCPHDEPFPAYFWKLSPFSSSYANHLCERNIPYRQPIEFIPQLECLPNWFVDHTYDASRGDRPRRVW